MNKGLYELFAKPPDDDCVVVDLETHRMFKESWEQIRKPILMNNKEFEILVDQTFERCRDLLVTKGGEYADDIDRLANFKRGSKLTGQSPAQVCLIYMAKHFDAVASWTRDPDRPSSEPITSRLDDMINYCLLMQGIVDEYYQGTDS